MLNQNFVNDSLNELCVKCFAGESSSCVSSLLPVASQVVVDFFLDVDLKKELWEIK